MYFDHFGLREAPFRITPQTEYFFAGAQRGAMLDALLFAIAHDEGIIKVTGEVGTGKTMLCRMMLERLPTAAQTIYIANPSLTPRELQETLARELGADAAAGPASLRWIEERLIALYADGKRVVTIVDEAHAMPRESLELVRLLSNLESSSHKLLQIVLFGQSELDALLATREMRSLRERITQSFQLAPLSRRDIGEYLRFRLQAVGYRGPDLFAGAALKRLAIRSEGLTRRINILADKTLLAAFTDNTCNVGSKHVKLAIRDADYPRKSRRLMWAGAAAGLMILIAAGLGWLRLMTNTSRDPERTVAARNATEKPTTKLAGIAATTTTSPSATKPVLHEELPQPSTAAVAALFPFGPLARARLEASHSVISLAAANEWFIQLQRVSAPDTGSLEGYLERLGKSIDMQQVYLYQARIDNRPHLGVIYGRYVTARDAARAVAALPDWVRQNGAYIRRYAALKGL